MIFIVESSTVPIYNRIALAFINTLRVLGHTVHYINPIDFTDESFINTINNIEIDFYISTNELNKIQHKSQNNEYFIFEKINARKIYIHHDNLFSGINELSKISQKISAFINSKKNSFHFCLEKSNVGLLKNVGILNAFHLFHASEFNNLNLPSNFQCGVSFVGHLMSSLKSYPTECLAAGEHLRTLALNRFSSSRYAIQPQLDRISSDLYIFPNSDENQDINIYSAAKKQFLIANINKLSSAIRGDYIRFIKNQRVDIFGGDLSYGTIKDPLLKIDQENIYYNPATSDYQFTSNIYKNTRINLNFTALQFDTAMNNRCVDVINSGGFLITDAMSDFLESDELAREISFDSPEEMLYKINYYSYNDSRYKEVKEAIQINFSENYNYINQVQKILTEISNSKF